MRLGHLVAAAALLTASLAAHADTVIYDSFTTYSSFISGGGGSATSNGVVYSKLFAQEITPAAGSAGLPITRISYEVGNANSSALNVYSNLVFFSADGANGGPGSVIDKIPVAGATIPGSLLEELTISDPNGFLATPSSPFYLGVFFSDGGTGGITAAQMNNIGTGLYSAPASAGSATPALFTSSAAYSGSSNPQGTLSASSSDIAFYLVDTAAPAAVTPEPSSFALLGTGLLGALGLARKRFA